MTLVKGLKYVINKQKVCSIVLVSVALILMLTSISGAAPFAYITNSGDNTVSVIDTATNTVTATVTGLNNSYGVAVAPDGTKVYVTNFDSNTVSVIDAATNTVTATVPVGNQPTGVAVTPDGSQVYATNRLSRTISVIDTITNTVTSPVNVGVNPLGVAVTPDGTKAYVANNGDDNVSVIDTTSNTVVATIPVGHRPGAVAVTPDGINVYVTNLCSDDVSVINTITNKVTATVNGLNIPNGVVVIPDGTKAYVADYGNATVSVIDTATNNITATVPVAPESCPFGVAVSPDGTKVYVANYYNKTVSVINTTYNTVTTTAAVGNYPIAFGNFIGPMPITHKITPTITWNNPADIVYGTPLSNVQLDAIASVPGHISYNPDSGTVLSVGTHTLTATLKPTDSTNYTIASASVSINVTQSTPAITWSDPANITYGTLLSSTQLDASASVPGTFVYTPPLGTVLSAGAQTLSTSFMPTDTVNYTTASKSVSITVTPSYQGAALTIKKVASPMIYTASGQTITYIYTVTNLGNVDINTPITVTDDKFGTITIPNPSSGILSPGSSITGTSSYKITDTDINTGSVSNLATATGLVTDNKVTSNNAVGVILYEYEHPEHRQEHPNNERDFGPNYGGAFVPPMMYGNPMYSSPIYNSGPSYTTETPNSGSSGSKTKASLNKHKQKNHSKHHKIEKNYSKHHKAGKKASSAK